MTSEALPRHAWSWHSLHKPVLWGLVVGSLQAASPAAIWWLDSSTVLAVSLTLIAAVYIGFAVADGRPAIIAIESSVAGAFVIVAAICVTASPWFLVAGFAAHGAKDFWQERTQFVRGTRWWPPFCATVDWLLALILTIEISAGVAFSH